MRSWSKDLVQTVTVAKFGAEFSLSLHNQISYKLHTCATNKPACLLPASVDVTAIQPYVSDRSPSINIPAQCRQCAPTTH